MTTFWLTMAPKRTVSREASLGPRDLGYGLRVNTAEGAIFVVAGCAFLAYGLLNIFAPQLTTRWQVRSTARHGGSRRAVGTGFQRLLGIDPDADPWDDAAVKRRVRWIGLVEVLLGVLLVVLGSLMWAM